MFKYSCQADSIEINCYDLSIVGNKSGSPLQCEE